MSNSEEGTSGGYSHAEAPPAAASSGGEAAKSSATAASAFLRPSKETVLSFLTNATKRMQCDETRQSMQDPSITNADIGSKLVQLQRAEWDPLGVDRDWGCSCLDRIEEHFPGDTELIEARIQFIQTCERTFLRTFKDRAPSSVESKKPMDRESIIQFFDACNTQMSLPEFQELLVRHMQEQKGIPNKVIVEMQRDMLEILGFEREHGCRELSAIPKNFPHDQEMLRAFQRWQQVAQQTCMRLVQRHMAASGNAPAEFPGAVFANNPLMEKHQAKAKEALDGMTPEERGELIHKMQKKISVFVQLPPAAQESHINKLSEEEQLEFVKAQILIVSVMRQQWEAHSQQHQAGCPNEHGHGHGHAQEQQQSSAEEAPLIDAPPPPQQQMMM